MQSFVLTSNRGFEQTDTSLIIVKIVHFLETKSLQDNNLRKNTIAHKLEMELAFAMFNSKLQNCLQDLALENIKLYKYVIKVLY